MQRLFESKVIQRYGILSVWMGGALDTRGFALRTAVRGVHQEDGRSGGEGKRGRFIGSEDSNVKWNGDHEHRGEFSRAARTALPVGELFQDTVYG
jgi:hypothetical protein